MTDDLRDTADDGPAPDDAALFASLYPALRRFAAAAASNDVEPDDLVQEALASLLSTREIGSIDNPEAYLRRSILNLESNHRRSQARRRTKSRLISSREPDPIAYPSDLADLESLEPDQRAILFLFEVEGRPFAEVAEMLDQTESTIRRRATTARRQLRASIERES